jgi:hypothetical protein
MKGRQNQSTTVIAKASLFGAFAFVSVASAQNVGIGFSNPASKLTVNGNFAVGADYNAAAPTNGAIIEGNVGIGTSSPLYPLHVVNSSGEAVETLEGNNGTGIGGLLYLLNDSTTSRKTTIDMTQPGAHTGFQLDVDYTQSNVNDFTIYDNVNNAYPIYIDSTDQVGLSTVNPRFRLEVSGPAAVVGGAYPTAENAFALGWNIVQPGFGVAELVNFCGTGGGNAFDFFLVRNSGTPSTANVIASINQAGVYSGSDERLKTSVQPLHYGLREVMDLAPKEYDLHLGKSFKDGVLTLEPSSDHQLGFLAQDVYRVVPEAVQKPKDPANEIYKMNYSILVPVLVNAVQELKHLQDETVAQQRARITQQESKIASLEAELASVKEANGKLAAMASKLEALEKAVNTIQVRESGKAQAFAINGNN